MNLYALATLVLVLCLCPLLLASAAYLWSRRVRPNYMPTLLVQSEHVAWIALQTSTGQVAIRPLGLTFEHAPEAPTRSKPLQPVS